MTGFVGYRNAEPRPPNLRHFEIQTRVYDGSSSSKSAEFSIYCYFTNTDRWKNTPVPKAGSCVVVTGKVVGRVMSENCLAVQILDMSFLPLSLSAVRPSSSSTQRTPVKRSNRWDNRVETPSKRMHTSEDDIVVHTSDDVIVVPSTQVAKSSTQSSETELEWEPTQDADASSEHHSRITRVPISRITRVPIAVDSDAVKSDYKLRSRPK